MLRSLATDCASERSHREEIKGFLRAQSVSGSPGTVRLTLAPPARAGEPYQGTPVLAYGARRCVAKLRKVS